MACESIRRAGVTAVQRKQQIDDAIKRLEEELDAKRVKVVIGPNGELAFKDWNDRDDVTDACAYRSLSARSSPALRAAIAKAENFYGRKVNQGAVAAGTHSHDGGHTWGKH